MKAVVLLLVFFVSCQDTVHYHYDTRVVEDYSEHFRTLDSIEDVVLFFSTEIKSLVGFFLCFLDIS